MIRTLIELCIAVACNSLCFLTLFEHLNFYDLLIALLILDVELQEISEHVEPTLTSLSLPLPVLVLCRRGSKQENHPGFNLYHMCTPDFYRVSLNLILPNCYPNLYYKESI